MPITAKEVAGLLHHTLGTVMDPGAAALDGPETGVAGERGYGEFILVISTTGQRFRITLTELD